VQDQPNRVRYDGWLPAPLLPEAATSAAAPAPPLRLASPSDPLLTAGACP
jgi:hypothetical protein